MGQSPFSIDSEVGATLFGKSLRLGFSFYQGQDPQASLQYSQAMSNLLMARDFNLTDFQKAVNNFKLGSSTNLKGQYNHLEVIYLKNPQISKFFPLTR